MIEMVTLTIDGKEIAVPKGTTLLDAARALGIEIPALCAHSRLTPLGACRMCLVEVEGMDGLQTACTTLASEGTVVRSDTPEVREAQRGMLEFLLTNHPLDCPVCDKGGECLLQDLTYKYGSGVSRFVEEKYHFEKPVALSPLIVLDRERCILCQRCVRFMEEVAVHPVLSLLERGRATEVATLSDPPFNSKFSGNTVDLCPVGALTSRDFRFRARVWELKDIPTICPHCGCGCHITLGVRGGELKRIVARSQEAVNEEWICDKGRFAHHFVRSQRRLQKPLVRRDGELVAVSWDEALDLVAQRFRKIKGEWGPHSLAGIGSVRCTNEEHYLFQRFMRQVLGTNNVDHRLEGGWEVKEPLVPRGSFAALERVGAILLLGADPSEEAPILDLRIKKAVRRGVRLIVANPREIELSAFAHYRLFHRPGTESLLLASILQAMITQRDRGLPAKDMEIKPRKYTFRQVSRLTGVPAERLREAAQIISGADKLAIIYSPERLDKASYVALSRFAQVSGEGSATFLPLGRGNNSQGAWDMGVLPHLYPGYLRVEDEEARERLSHLWECALPREEGLDTRKMMAGAARGQIKGLYILGADPLSRSPHRRLVEEALRSLDLLVVADLFLTETAALADVVLPAVTFAEKEGTFTNLEGRWQAIHRAADSPGEALADGEILTALAERMGHRFPYASVEDIRSEIEVVIPTYEDAQGYRFLKIDAERLLEEGPVPLPVELPRDEEYPLALLTGELLFDGGTMVGESELLDYLVPQPFAELNLKDAKTLGVEEGDMIRVSSPKGHLELRTHLSKGVSKGTVFIPQNLPGAPVNLLTDMDRHQTYVKVEKV